MLDPVDRGGDLNMLKPAYFLVARARCCDRPRLRSCASAQTSLRAGA
jgi:hypothetical protein